MPELIQRSFTGGELAPALRSRTDINKYASGLALCENMIIRPQGGVYSRPGLRYVMTLNATHPSRLIPFKFSPEQNYVLVFTGGTLTGSIQIVRDGGQIPFTFSGQLYNTARLPFVKTAQSADVMYIVTGTTSVQQLRRLADNNWTLSNVNFAPPITPPVWNVVIERNITNISAGTNPTITTSVAHGFSVGWTVTIFGTVDPSGPFTLPPRSFVITAIGSPTTFTIATTLNSSEYFGTDITNAKARVSPIEAVGTGAGDFDKTYTYVVTAVNVDGVESIAGDPRSITTKSLSQTAGVRLGWRTVSGAVSYRVYKNTSNNSTAQYGWIGDSNSTIFEDYNIAPIPSDAPPMLRDPFAIAGGENNKPAAINLYQQRLIFANTKDQPQTVFTSQVGVFNSLRESSPARADDAITFTISSSQVQNIRHIVALDSLLLLTSGGEWRVTEGQDQVMTPSTTGVRVQSYNGASLVDPATIGDTVVYVQEKGSRLRDIKYEMGDDRFSGNDLSILSEHLFEGRTVKEMAYAAEPFGILWCVMTDGVLLGLTYQREHQVWAWHQHNTDGFFESITVIPEDGRDAVYLVVRRVVNGTTRRYLERMEPRFTNAAEDAFCVDSGLSYDGAPATVFSGLTHLEGKAVAVLADGLVIEGKTVSGGAVTLDTPASKVHIGLPYTPAIETLDIDTAEVTLKARNASVSRVTLEVEKSRGGWVGPKRDNGSTGLMTEIKPRFDADNYDTLALKTFKQQVHIEPQWSQGGGIRIEQRAPLPLAILSVIPEVDVG